MKDVAQLGWETKTLGEVAAIVNGGTPKSKVAEYWGGDVQWLTPKDMGQMEGREVAKTPRTITEAGLAGSSARLAPAGSVILSTRAPIGHLAMNTVPMAFNQGCRGVFPSKRLDPVYLFHFLDMSRELLNSLGTGTTFKELSSTSLKSVKIPLPPLEEQHRIVAVLDEAFEGLARARAHAEANLQNARELFESFLDSAFSSFAGEANEQKLEDLISISHGFAFKSADFEASTDASLPIVLTPGNYTEDACLNFTEKNTKRLTGIVPADFLFEPGELTVVMTDLSSKMKILGKPAFIERDGVLHNQRIGRIRFKSNDLHPRFLFHFLRTQAARKPIRDTATGTMVRHTAPKRILNVVMRTPVAFLHQERIVSQIDEVESKTIRLRVQYTKTIQDIDDLRQSLLKKAFAGELT